MPRTAIWWHRADETRYEQEIDRAVAEFPFWTDPFVEPALLMKAIMARESAFDPGAYNPEKGQGNPSSGLMQIRLSTARGLGFTGNQEALYDPGTNTRLAAKLLQELAGRLDHKLWDMVAAYNAGQPRKVLGAYVNQKYVDDVRFALGELGGMTPGIVAEHAETGSPSFAAVVLAGFVWWLMQKRR